MVESGIFSVDIDEALGLTTTDYKSPSLCIDRSSPGLASPGQENLSWPYHSNQESGQALCPTNATPDADTAHQQSHRSNTTLTPVMQRKRIVRPESVGNGSPGFAYSRPEIKLPDQRRNLGGKMMPEPVVRNAHLAETDADQTPETHHKGPKIAIDLPNEPESGRSYVGQSPLQQIPLPTLQAASIKSKVVEPSTERLNEEDCHKPPERVEKHTPPDELEHPLSEMGHERSSKPSNPSHAPNTIMPLTELTRSNLPVPHRGNQAFLQENSTDTRGIHGASGSPSDHDPTRSVLREHPSHSDSSVLKPQATGKIEKRRSGRQAHEYRVPQTAEDDRHVPDQVEILQILAFRAKKERDAHRATTRDLAEHKKQLKQIGSEYADMETQLNQGLERERAQKSELERFKNLLSGLKGKAKKLDDYIKGLSNDHNKLRDDAISLRQHSESLQEDRRVIQTALADIGSALQHVTTIDKGALTEARLQVDNLQKVINQQHSQLMDKSSLLDTERKRLRTLEGELARIATSQERMAETVRVDQKELLKGLQVTLEQSQKLAQGKADKTAIPPAALKRCVELLEQIHKKKIVEPEELHQFSESIQAQLESITTTVKEAKQELDGHHGLETNLLSRFESLIAGFKSQGDLAEKAGLLREAESTLRERTQANENLLALSREQIKDLQNRESIHLQSIANLQAKLSTPIAPNENPRLLQRVHQLETRDHDLQQEAASLQVMIDSLKEQSNVQDRKLIEATENIRQGELAMEEVKALTAKIEQVKVDYVTQANIQHESLRQELLKASIEEKRLMVREHANVLHQLQRQLSVFRDSNNKMEGKLQDATRVQEEQTHALDDLRIQIGQHAYEKKENEKSIRHLEAQLQEATQNALSKDAEIQNLEEANAAFEREKNEAQAERDEAAHRLASQVADTAFKHTNILAQVNALCAKGDKKLIPATTIEDSLKILARRIDSLLGDSQATCVATQGQSQELLFSSEGDPNDRNERSDGLEDVALIKGSQGHAGQKMNKSELPARRTRAGSQVRTTPFRDIVQESHVEETTTVRRVRRTTSSQGIVDDQSQTRSPRKRREVLPVLAPFSEPRKDLENSTQGTPGQENMKEFFPATPLQPAWPQSAMRSSHSMVEKAPITTITNREREIPSILRKPTSSVIRGDLATSPTPIQSTHFRSKTRVEASSSKTQKSLNTTETIKESNVPKSILKPSRTSKRSATDASLETASQPSQKRAGTLGTGLGPILSSQSRETRGETMPRVEGKKKGTKRRGSGKDKYQERFAGGI